MILSRRIFVQLFGRFFVSTIALCFGLQLTFLSAASAKTAHAKPHKKKPVPAAPFVLKPAPTPAVEPVPVVSCNAVVKKIADKAVVEIVYVFGYKDSRPAKFVYDKYERINFLSRLQGPCGKNQLLCEFQRSDGDAFIFSKSIGEKKIFIKVIGSSVTENDEENRNMKYQDWLSLRARNELHWGLQRADVVFYNGHSRSGGGPDFFVPKLRKDQHIDYDYYLTARTHFVQIVETLRKAKKKSKVFGIFSCKADEHFAQVLVKENPDILFVAARKLISYYEALNESEQALEAILHGKCEGLPEDLVSQ